jgi:beta-xylosidase
VYLWKASDLESWESLGQVWSIERDATGTRSAWQRERRVNPDDPGGPLVRGMVSPEIHCFDGTYWLTYSMNGQGTGLLKSTSGKAAGPYVDLGRFTEQGSDASIFVDEDGVAYWVVGQGWIARMTDDRSGLSEHPKLLRCADYPKIDHGSIRLSATHAPRYPGLAGAHLFKTNGRYWLAAAAVRDRIGVGCYDTFVVGADSIIGPYGEPHLMIPHGGQTTVFEGPDGRLLATFAGRDSRAVFRDRPAIVPLEFTGEVLYGPREPQAFPRIRRGVMTEFGPWDRVRKVAPFHIRDLQFTFAPDGYAYLTGSGTDPAYAGRIMLFRSRDMKQWEPVDVQFDFRTIPGVTEEDYRIRFKSPNAREGLQAKYMDSEIYFLEGTFHIFTTLYGMRGVERSDGSPPFHGPMWLRSTTGKAEGPYEYVDRARSQSSVFVDDDGATYLFFNGNLMPFDPKGNTLEGNVTRLQTTAGTRFTKGDVATNLAKIGGKYVVFATAWCGGAAGENYRIDGTYDWVYWQSDTLEGPYEMPRRAYAMPHCGHSCAPQRGPDGRWYGAFFGNESTSPWLNYPGIAVFDVRLDPDDTVRVEILEETP